MTDRDLLKEYIKDSGTTMVALSEHSGIERSTLYNRLNGLGEFNAVEISGLTKALRLTKEERDAIFFADGLN